MGSGFRARPLLCWRTPQLRRRVATQDMDRINGGGLPLGR
jgi:hypothetical protein